MSSGSNSSFALYRRLAGETRDHRGQIAAIFVLSMLAAPLALLTPVPLKIAVDSVIGADPIPAFLGFVPDAITDSKNGILLLAALMFVSVAVLAQLQDLITSILKTYTGERLVLRFRGKLFQQSQLLSLAYHDRVGTSDSTYRVQEDAKSLQYIAVESLISLITAATTLVAMVYVTALIDFQLALVALAVSPPLLIAAKHFRPRMRDTSREVKRLESGALSVVQEVLTGLRVVKSFGQEDRERERFVGRLDTGMKARIRLRVIEGGYALLVGAIIGVGSGVVLLIGTRHVQQGKITLGELLLVMGYLTQLYAPIRMMARKAGSLQDHLASAERAFALLDQAPEVPERSDARALARAAGAVEFRNVTFAYEPDRLALDSVSFTVEPGMRVGVMGPTGAGKTTLVNLLTRLYDPTAGQVLLDGVDIRDYRLADLRNQFGIVLQDPVLFSTSIGENIAYARPDATQEEIEAAAVAANIHDFVSRLPEGYDTPVGERGMRLSGGERQRLSLARAFLKDARILILDEPTSSVDVETEANILEAMERLMIGRTSFMIAHRLSTLEACELRLELRLGRIALPASSPRVPGRQRATRERSPEPSTGALNGSGVVLKTGAVIGADEAASHPAVSAWRSLGGSKPWQMRVLKAGRHFRKRGVYRLEGAGPDRSHVIAKLCDRRTAEVECTVYEHLIPRLPLPALRCYGRVQGADRDRWWLFLEDAGSERYSPANAEHRRLAARWLATVQLHGAAVLADADLPDRGSRHYLVHLLRARDEIARLLRRPGHERSDALVLEDLLSTLEMVESSWSGLAAFCDTLPRTLVHGDLVPKNVRIRRDAGEVGLAVFDWEMAGVGAQLADLAQLLEPERSEIVQAVRSKRFDRFSANPCLATYRSTLAASQAMPDATLDVETVQMSAAIGGLFRCLAGIDWTCSQATPVWCPVDDFRVYSQWLGDAVESVGLRFASSSFEISR